MRNIPYIQAEDCERWRKALAAVSPRVSAAIKDGALQNGRQLALHFRNGINDAILAYVTEDVSQFRSKLRDALARFWLFFSPEFQSKVDAKYVLETSEEALCASLVLQDSGAEKLAEQLLPYLEGSFDARAKFSAGLAALLAGQRLAAEEIARGMMASPTPSHGRSLPEAILAIAQRDSRQFLAAIGAATAEFDKHVASEARGTPEAAIFLRGAALVRLYEATNQEGLERSGLDVRLIPSLE